MRQRVACLWLPNWPIQNLHNTKPELKQQAVVLHANSNRGSRVVACSRNAQEHGVCVGMSLAEADALLDRTARRVSAKPRQQRRAPGPAISNQSVSSQAVYVAAHDAAADVEALRAWARWCHRYSPLAGIEEAERPECLLLDITGVAHLFSGEHGLARQIVQDFQNSGLFVLVAVADSVGAAWALAHFQEMPHRTRRRDLTFGCAPGFVVVPSTQHRQALRPLPIEALRLPPQMLQTLRDLQVCTIGQLADLPRSTLPSRFGNLLLQRIDQAWGTRPELLTPERPLEPVAVSRIFEYPTEHRPALELVLNELIEQITSQLASRRAGVQRLQIRLLGENCVVAELSIGTVRPCCAAKHLLELVLTHLERVALKSAVSQIEVQACDVASLEVQQRELFDEAAQYHPADDLAVLFNRLSNRLGEQAVLRPSLVADAQPEYAFRLEPLIGGPPDRAAAPALHAASPFARPLRLTTPALAVAVTSVVPHGPPIHLHWQGQAHNITRSWGPERIETGWWRNRSARRDYYRVELGDGRWLWLYRELNTGRWFLHGVFE